ncbi:hypothetical protein Ahu01nite_052640 [Winogradskya humida]|uniref:Uncharacterized protein n=1 Tax=Winogradskya humida TaxID=113566 RepID=A0ABQ3ZVG8_9ACTN|nr:hypothetical protein Ahu01nite_052640 [Actinoplanes humidus]
MLDDLQIAAATTEKTGSDPETPDQTVRICPLWISTTLPKFLMNPRQVEQSYSDRSRNRGLVPAGKESRNVSQSESRSRPSPTTYNSPFDIADGHRQTGAGGRLPVGTATAANFLHIKIVDTRGVLTFNFVYWCHI